MSHPTWRAAGPLLLALLSSSLLTLAEETHRADGVPDVTIAQGVVKGSQATTRNGRDLFSYRGIPYAKPPVGALRFKAPEPLEPGSDVIDATKDASICTHMNYFVTPPAYGGQEDCLTINVYTPQISEVKLPVMVWIHGGGFFTGTGASHLYGPEYLLDKDIVLVTFNYRLGALGFLSTADSVAPGNYGLKDQVAALKWVQDNIAAFGGDRESVTIFGQSAGGASVHLHMMSSQSEGLFHRAISESGTAVSDWAWPPLNPYLIAKKQAEFFDCPTEDSQQLVDCLREVDDQALAGSADIFHVWSVDPMVTLGPVVEDPFAETSFLTGHPVDLMNAGSFRKVPWMMGVVAQEGIIRGQSILSNKTLLNDLNTNWNTLGPEILELPKSIEDPLVQQAVWKNVSDFYFQGQLPVTEENGIHLIDLCSDRAFMHSVHKSALSHAQNGHDTVYMYNFNYRGRDSYANYFAYNPHDYGICHNDDRIYLFKDEGMFPDWPENHPDLKMVDSMVTLWTNFAIYGTPTPPLSTPSNHVTCDLTSEDRCDVTQLQWSPVPPGRTTYLNIYSTNNDTLHFSMDQDFYKDRMAFWDEAPLVENLN